MNINSLYDILQEEPSYRLAQAKRALFIDLVDDWEKAKVLPKELREKLNETCPISISSKITEAKDRQSAKAVIILEDGAKIETVLMRHKKGRETICVSSQVGCPLGCLFCATGNSGFTRNLTKNEILEQVFFWARFLKEKCDSRIHNIVFMGMGEPFLNYEQVMAAIRKINDKDGFNIGARHISISTAGIVEGIKRLAKEGLQINLAISLHATSDKLREEIMPVAKKYPLKKIFMAVNQYIALTNRQVMFEYLLLKNVNDRPEDALKLAELMKYPLCIVNLLTYNSTKYFQASSPEAMNAFQKVLVDQNIKVTSRYRFGDDISAACGQLAKKA
jgi:23S rRNA (adenine2503-C2)-methyltransferase